MTDLSPTIAPKSNQLNADDLISGPITITVTKVSAATAEQPIAINFDGDRGKPYFPCKSMRRVMVMVWGADGSQYAGKSMTLYRDPGVKFGGIQVGGIRISHMSHMAKDTTMALAETKAARKPFTVRVLKQAEKEQRAPEAKPVQFMDRVIAMLNACKTVADVDAVEARPAMQKALTEAPQDVVHELNGRLSARRKELEMVDGAFDPETGEVAPEWAA
jgi:hypothetical protein